MFIKGISDEREFLMDSPEENHDDGYDCFRILIQQLCDEGFLDAYRQLNEVFYNTPCTTGNELIGNLGLVLRDFLRTGPRVTPPLRKSLKACKKKIRKVCGPFFFW